MSDAYQQSLDGVTPQVDQATDSDTQNTPSWLVGKALEFFGGPPALDPCTNEWSSMPARRKFMIGRGEDGLSLPWNAHTHLGKGLWINPPYSDPWPWLLRANQWPGVGLALVKHDHTTRWWRDFIRGRIRCNLNRRVAFDSPRGPQKAAPFPSTLVLFDGGLVEWRFHFLRTFADAGEALEPMKRKLRPSAGLGEGE